MKRVLRYAALPVAIAVVLGLWLFQPWKAFTSNTVNETAPISETTDPATPAPGSGTAPTTPPPSDQTLAEGAFENAEHATSGKATVLKLADGRRFVRFSGLASSDGPDLHVWLSDQPSGGDWGSYDDGRYVKLGKLKGTHGNQNYAIPAEVDLSGLMSVVIWCDRFNVAFGTAPVSL